MPIDRTNKTALDANLVNGVTSDAPKVKANNDTLYNFVDGLESADSSHSGAATLAHPDQSVTTAKIKDLAVTTGKIADGAITNSKIASGTIDATKFVAGALANETQNGLAIVEINEQLADIANVNKPVAHFKTSSNTWSDALFAAINWVNAQTSPVKLGLPSVVFSLTTMLTINPMRVSLVGTGGTVLDFSGLVAGTCIKFEGMPTAGESISSNKKRKWEGITVKGNPNLTLVDVSTDLAADSAAITLENVHFDTGSIGLNLGNNAWHITLDKFSFENCTICINELQDNAPTVTNFGERNVFKDGLFSGTGLAYKSRNYNSDAHFIACSFDTNKWFDLARGAKAYASHSHFETQSDEIHATVEGTNDGYSGALLSIRDSWITLPGGAKFLPPFQIGRYYSVGNGGLDLDNVYINIDAGVTMDRLVIGDGKVSARRISTNYDFNNYAIAESLNELYSGNFESTNLNDWTFVDPGNPPLIDNTTANAHTGDYSMRMVGAGGTAIIGGKITRNVKVGQNVFLNLWYKLDNVIQGTFSYNRFVILIRVYDKKGNLIANEENYFSGTNSYQKFNSTMLKTNPMPKGADTLEITVQMSGCTGTAWVDDLILNIMD